MRSGELTLPGFMHDTCSAVHPLGLVSPFFRALDLARHGLTWLDSPVPVAHVLNDGSAVVLERSIEKTADQLGPDAAAYRQLMEPFVRNFDALVEMILGPLRIPYRPFLFARFGLSA